jgi:hypothetical protein
MKNGCRRARQSTSNCSGFAFSAVHNGSACKCHSSRPANVSARAPIRCARKRLGGTCSWNPVENQRSLSSRIATNAFDETSVASVCCSLRIRKLERRFARNTQSPRSANLHQRVKSASPRPSLPSKPIKASSSTRAVLVRNTDELGSQTKSWPSINNALMRLMPSMRRSSREIGIVVG